MVNMQCTQIFGQNLRALREEQGQTLQMFASACDCSMYTIQSYELGRKCPNFARFLKICNAHRASPNKLLAGLFSDKNELSDIVAIESVFKRLSNEQAKMLSGLLDIIIECMINTEPKFENACFGLKLHLLRLNAKISVDDLAGKCLIAKPTLLGYESSQTDPSLPVLSRLCNIFHVSPEYLLASNLEFTSYSDGRYSQLRPHEITSVFRAAAYFEKEISLLHMSK